MLNGIRGTLLDFIEDPFYNEEEQCVRCLADGLLVIENGTIKDLGPYNDAIRKYPGCRVEHYPGYLIMPGFIDAHVHYSQMGIIASYGKQLLEWLEAYVYPEEGKFADYDYARGMASLFLDELLRNGTTTAAVFTTVHPRSVDAFFEESLKRNMRMIAGKVLMDRGAPGYLLDTPQQSYEESKRLIEKWHGNGRQLYAVTPRFGITCTREQLDMAARLKEEFPGVYIHTHLSENVDEVQLTLKLFPYCGDYLTVYEKSGLVTDRSIFAHGIHLSDSEIRRLSNAGSTIAFCPSSNLFLGSGLFNLGKFKSPGHPVHVGVGTDVGAGTSLSLLRTLDEAYKVLELQNQKLSAFKGFYLLTLGGARGLSLEDRIGNFEPGKEADIVVLDMHATPLLKLRNSNHRQLFSDIRGISDRLFTLICMGDDRVVVKTYVAGSLLYERG
jgi:guanine deaminase